MAQQMNLFIRPAMASDAPEIHHIVQLAFAEYASLLGPWAAAQGASGNS